SRSPEIDAERKARIRALESELAALRESVGRPSADTHLADRQFLETLQTVSVPEAFTAPFLEAQKFVAGYFAQREEDPSTGSISIAGERYVLVRAASLSVEFVELVSSLYRDKGEEEALRVANNLLYDVAHAIGRADARNFRKRMNLEEPIEALSAGPVHFAFAGWAFVDIHAVSNPTPDEDFLLVYDHPYSFESHSWIAHDKRSDKPVCIMNAGYSSGWCEESFGVPVVAVETECQAAGGERCHFVMAPPGRIEERLREHGTQGMSSARDDADANAIPEFFHRKRLEDELRAMNEQLEERVEERTRELQAANKQLQLLGSAIENATEGFVIMERSGSDGDVVISFVNHGFTRITGLEPGAVIGKSPDALPAAEDDRPVLLDIRDQLRKGRNVDAEITAIRPDGREYELEVHVMIADPDSPDSGRWIAILHDVSERKAYLDALQKQALHDDLTGLPNRALFRDRMEHLIQGQERSDTQFGLLLLDLDGFKEINDTFGHYVGDILLTKVAARLKETLRSIDTIARLGGDEFAVLLEGIDGPEEADHLAKRLLEALRLPFGVEQQNLVVNASIGIVHCPEHGRNPDDLLRRADVAMYAAKDRHAGALRYDGSLDVHSPERIRLVSELRESVDDDHLVLHYQPQVEILSGKVTRVEALLRWRRNNGELLLPGAFLPLAEATDLIDQLTGWVMRKAVVDCCDWLEEGHDFGVSVNLAPRNLHDAKLPQRLRLLLEEFGLPPEYLTLEITESGILRDSLMGDDIFERLRALGVGLSIDDFGTGYSSLVHLKHLPFTELKIDRSFTRDIVESASDAAIVQSSIGLAHALGRQVVAEGVEDARTLNLLTDLDCDHAQGFHFTRGLPKEELLEWLAARKMT
ncbi:MAG: EAL domain-containing protein, partial [Gammaproteobacteria bacterium]|nr:EAL domain-containing protein [Gammaproteobacteria bacterium]